jgi:putative FmdB family regulatory protein
MPVYEYECGACEHRFEEWQKMSDPPVRTCPKCKKKRVERLISQTSFHLKGGGWYSDLYSSKKSSGSGGESGGGDGGGSGGGGKTETPKASKDAGSKDSGSKDSGSKAPANSPAPKKKESGGGGKTSPASA